MYSIKIPLVSNSGILRLRFRTNIRPKETNRRTFKQMWRIHYLKLYCTTTHGLNNQRLGSGQSRDHSSLTVICTSCHSLSVHMSQISTKLCHICTSHVHHCVTVHYQTVSHMQLTCASQCQSQLETLQHLCIPESSPQRLHQWAPYICEGRFSEKKDFSTNTWKIKGLGKMTSHAYRKALAGWSLTRRNQ